MSIWRDPGGGLSSACSGRRRRRAGAGSFRHEDAHLDVSATLHDIWATALPAGTQLAGGAAGLGRELRWVVTLRPRPPGFVGLKGGELVLLRVETLRVLDDRLSLARAVDQLARVGVVGMAARGPVDAAAAARADALGFPLLALPDDASLPDVEQAALRLLAERRAETLEYNRHLQQQLTELLIAGHGLPAIVDRLAIVTRRTVALEDHGGLRHLSGAAANLPERSLIGAALDRERPRLVAWIDGRPLAAVDPPSQRFELDLNGSHHPSSGVAGPRGGVAVGRVVAPIVVDDGARAFLSVIAPQDSLGRADAVSASQGATVCALVLARDRAVLQAEDRLHRDVVAGLLAGSESDAALLERAGRLGYDLGRPHLAMALRVETAGDAGTTDLASALSRELTRRGVAAPVGIVGDAVGLAYPLDGEEPARLAVLVHQLASQSVRVPVSAGVGRPGSGPGAIARGFHEGERALAVARRLMAPGRLVFFADLGVHRLLLALDGHPELGAFYEETLAAIDRYDTANRAELVPTLEAFFASDNSLAETAARLHLHRNTVAYRLRRIEQISGHRLADPETRLALHVGLRVRQALGTHGRPAAPNGDPKPRRRPAGR